MQDLKFLEGHRQPLSLEQYIEQALHRTLIGGHSILPAVPLSPIMARRSLTCSTSRAERMLRTAVLAAVPHWGQSLVLIGLE